MAYGNLLGLVKSDNPTLFGFSNAIAVIVHVVVYLLLEYFLKNKIWKYLYFWAIIILLNAYGIYIYVLNREVGIELAYIHSFSVSCLLIYPLLSVKPSKDILIFASACLAITIASLLISLVIIM